MCVKDFGNSKVIGLEGDNQFSSVRGLEGFGGKSLFTGGGCYLSDNFLQNVFSIIAGMKDDK